MILVVVGLLLVMSSGVEGKFKSLHCTVLDKNYGEFLLCKLKAINRYRNSINVLYRMKQYATNVTVRMEILKRASGWHPFLYNVTVGLCDLLKRHKNLILTLAHAYVKPYLTITDYCPWKINSTVKCDNFELDLDVVRTRFPFDSGEYAARFTFYYQDIARITINGSAEYINYKEK